MSFVGWALRCREGVDRIGKVVRRSGVVRKEGSRRVDLETGGERRLRFDRRDLGFQLMMWFGGGRCARSYSRRRIEDSSAVRRL